jgi:hypothetical protein
MSARVFSTVLRQPQLAELTEIAKIRLADQFTGVRRSNSLTLDEKTWISKCILTWDQDDCIRTLHLETILARYECDWVSPKLARPCLSRLVSIRRSNIQSMACECRSASSLVSRWFCLPWLSAIQLGESVKKSPDIKLIEFGRSFGGLTREIDVSSVGLVDVHSSKPISKAFKPILSLQSGPKYFLTMTNGSKELPWLEVDFGQCVNFVARGLVLDCESAREGRDGRILAMTLEIRGESADGQRFIIANDVRYENLRERKGKGKGRKIEFDRKVKCRKLLIRQKVPSAFGVNVLRIVGLDVVGHLTCRHEKPKRRRD